MVVMGMAPLDPQNDLRVALALYGPILLGLVGMGLLTRRGHTRAAAWGTVAILFGLCCAVLVLMGGLHDHNGMAFILGIMVAGALLGGRAALLVAVLSGVVSGVMLVLSVQQRLPTSLVPRESPLNEWIALSVSLLLAAVVLWQTLDSLHAALRAAEESARERDAANARFLTTQKMELVGQLSGGVAHDFNNLLTVVMASVGLLKQDIPEEDAESHSLLADITAATTRAELLTRRLLAFSRAQHSETLTPIDVSRLLTELEPMLYRLLQSSIRITLQAPERAVILADRAGLEQILLNLVVNAREALPRGGRITLSTTVRPTEVDLMVADDGVGMDAATQAHAFDPFFTTKRTGTGLGLTTVQELVRRFSGRIAVETAPQAGCRFTLTFPRSMASPNPATEGEITSQPGLRLRVLLVDDDALVRRATSRMLTVDGFDVTALVSAEEALALLDSRPDGHDLLITDLVMPTLSGGGLAQALQARGTHLPVLFISGHREHPIPTDLSFPTAFLPKPYDRRTLHRAIRQLLGLPA